MSTTRLLSCTCEHKYQDQKYGKGVRVHNSVTKDKTGKSWRCTVCGQVTQQEGKLDGRNG